MSITPRCTRILTRPKRHDGGKLDANQVRCTHIRIRCDENVRFNYDGPNNIFEFRIRVRECVVLYAAICLAKLQVHEPKLQVATNTSSSLSRWLFYCLHISCCCRFSCVCHLFSFRKSFCYDFFLMRRSSAYHKVALALTLR